MKKAPTLKEISAFTGMPISTLRVRSNRENWRFYEETGRGRGGKCKFFPITTLPNDIQRLYNKEQAKKIITATPTLPAVRNTTTPAVQNIPPRAQQKKALAKYDLLTGYLTHMEKLPWGNKTKSRKIFMQTYNAGLSYPGIYKVIGRTSWKTIEGWKTKLKQNGNDCFCLADTRGGYSRGGSALTREQQKIVLRCALHPNRPRISEVVRMAWVVMHAQGVQNGRHESTYRRWLMDWKAHNFHIWTFTRQGSKAWNDQCARYIERDYSLINVGDVVVADGHVLNFDIINPFTGKPKRMALILWLDMKSSFPLGWEIMPTENTAAISSALRRAILRLGKYPQVVYLDNGKAFKSRFFTDCDFDHDGFAGLYERMGIKTIFAWPYHGQSKTVERFFGTFAELERWSPTYVGTSIEKKPPRMMRGERLHGRVYDKLIGGGGMTLEQAHIAIAAWFDDYVRRPQSGHLNGLCPLELYLEGKGPGVDRAELSWLMMSRKIRHIRRNGIRFLGQNYYDPALYGRRHPVKVHYDLQDMSALYVFDEDGEYLCAAKPVEKIHPAAHALGDASHQKALEIHIRGKRSQEKAASVLARTFLEEEVLPEHRRYMERLGIVPGASPLADQKADQKALPEKTELTPDERKLKKEIDRKLASEDQDRRAEAVAEKKSTDDLLRKLSPPSDKAEEESTRIWSALMDMPEATRYEKLVEYEVRGLLIPSQWQAFMKFYEQSPTYIDNLDFYEQFRADKAIEYQIEPNEMLT